MALCNRMGGLDFGTHLTPDIALKVQGLRLSRRGCRSSPGGDHRVPLEERGEILPQGNLVEKKTEVGGDQQVVDDGEAVGWDRD